MNLRDATILGVVGAGGIGAIDFAINGYKWDEVGAIWLNCLIPIVEYSSSYIRKGLTQG